MTASPPADPIDVLWSELAGFRPELYGELWYLARDAAAQDCPTYQVFMDLAIQVHIAALQTPSHRPLADALERCALALARAVDAQAEHGVYRTIVLSLEFARDARWRR